MTFPDQYFGIKKRISSASTGNQHLLKTAVQYAICKVLRRLELYKKFLFRNWRCYTLLYFIHFGLSSLLPGFVSSVPYLEDSELPPSLTLSSESLNQGARYFLEESTAERWSKIAKKCLVCHLWCGLCTLANASL